MITLQETEVQELAKIMDGTIAVRSDGSVYFHQRRFYKRVVPCMDRGTWIVPTMSEEEREYRKDYLMPFLVKSNKPWHEQIWDAP